MCAPTVNYIRQKYGTATEKLAFECDKSFSGAKTNLYQQNKCMTSGRQATLISYSLVGFD